MKIGELATATGTPAQTIRFYEREQLLPETSRSEGNYRQYDRSHIERLTFIRHCRSLDMTLDEIRVLLRFRDAPGTDCQGVSELLDAHIGHVSQRIRELRALEKQLVQLREQCTESNVAGDCGILLGLSTSRTQPVTTHQNRRHVPGAH